MIEQSINSAKEYLLSLRKRLSETLEACRAWCSQKVRQFIEWLRNLRP